jgi:heparin/heparan-sulfate lyase
VEVKPGAARTDDMFLHMIQVGDATLKALPETTLNETDDALAISFTYEGKDYSLSFNKKSTYGCTVNIK